MKAVEFPEVNVRIAEHQPQYETLPVYVNTNTDECEVTMCFELDEYERKQVTETGKIWLTVLTFGNNFQPIGMSCLKPEGMTDPTSKVIDPLAVLREDVYSNEETNEMAGKMIREQYKSEQNGNTKN